MSMSIQHGLFGDPVDHPPVTRRRKAAPDVALHELEYAVVDVETTGSSHARADRIVEIAAVVVRGGKVAESFSTLVNPLRMISPAVTRLTGISNAMVADAPLFDHITSELHGMLEKRVFVAHNVGFDWAFVNEELDRATGRRLASERLCTVRLAKRILSHLPRRNLDAVSHHYGIRNDARHRALGDAMATARVFERMLDELGRQGIHTWQELRDMLTGRKKKKRRTALPHAMTDWSIA